MFMKKTSISESLKRLEDIASWFESRQEADIEKGLEKIKEGAVLIKESRARLKEVENEFEEVKKDLESSRDE